MPQKPRFYSTVPVEVFNEARRQLTNQQLRLFLFLEFKGGSDTSGIESDDPDLEGCPGHDQHRLSPEKPRLSGLLRHRLWQKRHKACESGNDGIPLYHCGTCLL